MPGVTAVVHLAGQPTEAPWPVIRDGEPRRHVRSVRGGPPARRPARRLRVVQPRRRVHAGEPDRTRGRHRTPPGHPVRSEQGLRRGTGRYYVDRYALRVACLRIGTFAPTPPDVRSLSTWLSPGDCARLVDACLRSDALTYSIVWGISGNTRRTWSLDAGAALGYRPADDAETYASSSPTTSRTRPMLRGRRLHLARLRHRRGRCSEW